MLEKAAKQKKEKQEKKAEAAKQEELRGLENAVSEATQELDGLIANQAEEKKAYKEYLADFTVVPNTDPPKYSGE